MDKVVDSKKIIVYTQYGISYPETSYPKHF